MKVVYLLNIFPKISETFILNEMLEMKKKGVEVEAFAYKDEKEDTVHPRVKEIQTTYFFKVGILKKIFSHFYWIFRNPENYLKTWALVIKHGDGIRKPFVWDLYDTVLVDRACPGHLHAHFGDESSNLAMLTHSLSGVPFTFTTHSYDIFNAKYHNWKVKSKLAKKHVTISLYNKNYILDRFDVDEKDVEIIHCGIDFSKIPAEGPQPDGNCIICVARLHEEKGIDVLIRACRRLKDDRVDFKCLTAGEGTARQDLEKLIRDLELENDVKLLGNQTHDQIFGLLRRAKVKVLSSRSEGIPVSLMEAMAFRVPVIATNICGIPELIEDGESGFLVPAGDDRDLAEKIKEILENKGLRDAFVKKGYETVYKEFNLDTQVDKLIAIWKA